MKTLKGILMFGLLSIFLAGCISIPIGDGKMKLSKDGVTITDEDGEEHTFNVEEDDGSVSITTDGETSLSFGENVEVPDKLPSDIPFTDDAMIYSAGDIDGVVAIIYMSMEDPEKINEMYKKYFDGGQFNDVITSNHDTDQAVMRSYQGELQDGTMLSVTITQVFEENENEETGTNITIGYSYGVEE